MNITSETYRDRTPAGTGGSGCVDEPAEVASTSAAQLCFSADPDCRPQPAETNPPSAVLAQPPQPAVRGCKPAHLPAAWSVHNFVHVLLLLESRRKQSYCVCVFQISADRGSCSLFLWTVMWS